MFDFLQNNALFVVIVAVSLVIRVIASRKKRREESSGETAEMIEPEKESGLGHWEINRPAAPVVSPKARAQPARAKPPLVKASVFPAPGLPDENSYDAIRQLSSGRTKGSVPVQPTGNAGTFPRKIENLPALKKALVYSEILARPKGLAAD